MPKRKQTKDYTSEKTKQLIDRANEIKSGTAVESDSDWFENWRPDRKVDYCKGIPVDMIDSLEKTYADRLLVYLKAERELEQARIALQDMYDARGMKIELRK